MNRTACFSLAVLTIVSAGCGANSSKRSEPTTTAAVADWLPSNEWVIDDRPADGRSEHDLMFDAVLRCVLRGNYVKPYLRNTTDRRIHVITDRPYTARLPSGWRAADVEKDGTPTSTSSVVIVRISGVNPSTTAPVKMDFGTGWIANVDFRTNDPMVFDATSIGLIARQTSTGWAAKWFIIQS